MMVQDYKKELAEMTKMWNCETERDAIRYLCHSHYIQRGCSPELATTIIDHLSDGDLAHTYISIMNESRKGRPIGNLLDLYPTN